jgi:hypothetical protein
MYRCGRGSSSRSRDRESFRLARSLADAAAPVRGNWYGPCTINSKLGLSISADEASAATVSAENGGSLAWRSGAIEMREDRACGEALPSSLSSLWSRCCSALLGPRVAPAAWGLPPLPCSPRAARRRRAVALVCPDSSRGVNRRGASGNPMNRPLPSPASGRARADDAAASRNGEVGVSATLSWLLGRGQHITSTRGQRRDCQTCS